MNHVIIARPSYRSTVAFGKPLYPQLYHHKVHHLMQGMDWCTFWCDFAFLLRSFYRTNSIFRSSTNRHLHLQDVSGNLFNCMLLCKDLVTF